MRSTLISPWLALIFARVVRTTASTLSTRVHVENLGDFYTFPTYLPTQPPVHVFQFPNSAVSSVVVGNQVIGFDQYGILVSNRILPYPEGATADYRIVAVDSHTSDLLYSNTESTFVAVAREYLNGSGSAISVFTVLEQDTYSLFSQILTKSSVRAIQLYTDYDGNLLVAAAQKTADCTEDWESECGLSLVYKIDGFSGEADIFDAFQTGNATNVKVVTDDNANTISLLYSTCATMHNGWQTCRILNQLQPSGSHSLNSIRGKHGSAMGV
ncbi:hypothetical protein RvY_08542-2 [Ramazzottius varieornatus]|uniref:Uncharacterized protein n=1 Tax=Ramazzottius varieornatus TaxID=947166 RepID=A0A1D1VE96_RAMVA|nr:hypothetical protein RvY_08542-2 [Ramazzottius varieornatus]